MRIKHSSFPKGEKGTVGWLITKLSSRYFGG